MNARGPKEVTASPNSLIHQRLLLNHLLGKSSSPVLSLENAACSYERAGVSATENSPYLPYFATLLPGR